MLVMIYPLFAAPRDTEVAVPAAPLPPAALSESDRSPDRDIAPVYLAALAAWESGDWRETKRLAAYALEIDPLHRPSMLLYGYALLRQGYKQEGAIYLSSLASFPAEDEYNQRIQRQARQLSGRYLARMTRDTPSISVGLPLMVERRWDGAAVRGGVLIQAQAEVKDVMLRVEAAVQPDGTELSIDGGRYSLLAGRQIALGDGLWHLDAAAGPALWFASGPYWPDQTQIWAGARMAIGADCRFSQSLGMRFETGWTWWPGAQAELIWFDQPMDVRIALTGWFPDPARSVKTVKAGR